MRYLVTLSYNGKNYFGWQKQVGQISIQETIESALFKIYGVETPIYASGRTDSGVHAYGQTFHFDAEEKYKDDDIVYRLNCILPQDIRLISIARVSSDFHARFNAKSKTYLYRIKLCSKDPFLNGQVCFHPDSLDILKFREACKLYVGTHNFINFTSKEEDEDNFVRTIYSIDLENDCDEFQITFSGNGFMRYQIRFMIGAAMAYAEGKEELSFIESHLDSKENRDICRYKSPGDGLYLVKVDY